MYGGIQGLDVLLRVGGFSADCCHDGRAGHLLGESFIRNVEGDLHHSFLRGGTTVPGASAVLKRSRYSKFCTVQSSRG